MDRRLKALCIIVLLSNLVGGAERPNLIFILADDLGYGDLGCYGQRVIQTPRLDQMAREGLRFTQFYAGATVCAPSRCVLMTGMHTGHCTVRGNAGSAKQALREDDVTVAELFKGVGYATALVGKWGLGDLVEAGRIGLPTRQGFEYFYGYLHQGHAHNYYPSFLIRNEERVPLKNVAEKESATGAGYASKKVQYSHDLFMKEATTWITAQKKGPFFLYLALTIPHANNEAARGRGDGAEVPDHGPYAGKEWPAPDRGHAAMITRMDRDVGALLDLLGTLGIAERTLVFFTSDNGPHSESRQDLSRFTPSGPLRGIKRDLYEGGIRVPAIAWWPGTVTPGTRTDHIAYFGDLMATSADLLGVAAPEGVDSLSFMPTLRGQAGAQKTHEYLYWEFYERRGARAVRKGPWKAVRPTWYAPVELYNLTEDIGEGRDVAGQHPEIVRALSEHMQAAHRPSERFTPPAPRKGRTRQ